MNEFGDYIKKLRIAEAMTLEDVSKISGIDLSHLSRVERGIKRAPRAKTLLRLAQALGVTYTNLMIKAGYIEVAESDEAEIEANYQEKKQKIESNKQEFSDNSELSDEKLMNKFILKLDGVPLSRGEYREMITYLRVKRKMSL